MGTANTFTFTSDTETVTRTKLNNLVANLLTEFNGSINNSNIKAAAQIAASKLNLATIAQNVAFTGTLDLTSATFSFGAGTIPYSALVLSNSVVNADINSAAEIAYSKLNLTGLVINADLAGSIADTKLNTISTAGKVDGASLTGLANIPAGAGDIPTANLTNATFSVLEDYGTSGTTSTSKNLSDLMIAFGTRSVGGSGSATVTNLPFTSVGLYTVVGAFGGNQGAVEAFEIVRDSASQITIKNNDNAEQTINWIAIGT